MALIEYGLSSNLIKDKLDLLVSDIVANLNACPHNGLFDGRTGISMLLYNYSRYCKNDDYKFLAENEIFEIIKSEVNSGINSLCSGLSGIGWFLIYLRKNKFINYEIEEVLEEIDLQLYNHLDVYLQEKNFDFLHGALGVCLYFSERRNQIAEDYITKTINCLYESAFSNGFNYLDEKEEDGIYYNLGLAHGIPSIILILNKISSKGYRNLHIKSIIHDCVTFLINHVNPEPFNSTHWPSLIPLGKSEYTHQSRLAWCYGDLTIALSLYLNKLSSSELKPYAIDVMNKTTLRKSESTTNVKDACICHGSIGLALIYESIFKETNIELFKEAEYFWLDKTLGLATHKDGTAGYKFEYKKNPIIEFGLLNGASGVALGLLSTLADTNNWEECLLIK